MDFGTIVGIILGMGLVVVSIFFGGGVSFFLDPTSILITFGGTIAACLVAYPWAITKSIPGAIRNAFVARPREDEEIVERLARYAEMARREGMISLDEKIDRERNPFLKKALRLALEGADPKVLATILKLEVRAVEERHVTGQNFLISAAGYAPAFGMLGTLIGLIQMLLYLDDPSKIGRGMAVALVTTFWGVLLSNLVFHPLAAKLRNRTREEKSLCRLIIEGVTSIQEGDSPRIVRAKLLSFVSPTDSNTIRLVEAREPS